MRCELLGVNKVYVDNLRPTSIEETLLEFWWNLYIYIYIKKKKKITRKKFPMYREIGCGKSGLLQLVSERGCDSVDLLSMESIMNRVF